MSGNWLDLSATSNRYIQTYMKGFLDMSGGNLLLRNNNIIVQTGDISLGGRLFVKQDVSINGNLYAKGTILFDPSSSTSILGTAIVNTINVGGIINQAIYSLSAGVVYVPTDPAELLYLSQYIYYAPQQLYSSTGTGTLVLGNAALTGYTTTTVVLGDAQVYGNAYFSGTTFSSPNMKTVNFGSATIGAGSASLSNLFVTSDVSINGRLILASDVSMGGNLSLRGNLILQNGAITMGYSTVPTPTSTQVGYMNNVVATTTGPFNSTGATVLGSTSLTGIYILNCTLNITLSVAVGNVTLTLTPAGSATINGQASAFSFTSYIGVISSAVTIPISCNLYMPSGASISGTLKSYGTTTIAVTASNFSFIRMA